MLLVLLLASLASVAVARSVARPGGLAEGASPELIEPLPFDHQSHDAIMRRKGVTCVTCHPVGARTADGAPAEPLDPPLGTCHACHLGELRGAPRSASAQCTQCHAFRAELLPADHRAGWMEAHAVEARALSAECSACHETRRCVDCHEARGSLVSTPHPPGFRATHGVEARVDPASCSSCHVEQTCTACHSTGVIPW